jgi:multiple sugar transport system ATP-binding protein
MLRKAPKAEINARVKRAAEILGLIPYLDRYPRQLSGGQRQRVAMGRAIVRSPKVFLMDEPLSNLDAKLRVQTRTQIAELQHRLGVTTVYVTHDQVEAMTMGDRVAVLKDGVLQQVDTPLNLYDRPRNKFVAGFIGSPAMNLIEAEITDGGAKIGDYVVPIARDVLAKAGDDKTLTLGIRPEAFHLADEGLPVKVSVIEELGSDAYLYGTAEHTDERQQIIARIGTRLHNDKGTLVHLAPDPDKLHLFSTSTEERLVV